MREGAVLIALPVALNSPDLVKALASRGVTSFAVETIPRTTRAQSMDALSSQAVVAGYRATLAARPAAGQVLPDADHRRGHGRAVARAGARRRRRRPAGDRHRQRLGAVVEAYDVRPAVKEEVESLGAKFVQIEIEQDAEGGGSGSTRRSSPRSSSGASGSCSRSGRGRRLRDHDRAVPGPAGAEARSARRWSGRCGPGSVIVDIAAETGGNCALTEPGAVVVTEDGVHDRRDAQPAEPDAVPRQPAVREQRREPALHMSNEGSVELDFEDEIVAGCCVTHDGRIVNERRAGKAVRAACGETA